MSVKTKLLIALSVILLAAFLATSLINYSITRKAVREELLTSSLPLTGKNIYSEIHAALMRPILVSSSMSNDAFLKKWVLQGEKNTSEIIDYLSAIQEEYGFITTFFVSAKTDTYYYQDGINKKINPRDPHDVWFYAFTRSPQKYELSVDTNQTYANNLTIFVNFRLEDDAGNLLGVAGVGVNMDNAIELLATAQKKYKRNVFLVDQDGLMQVNPDKSLIKKLYITEAKGIRSVADAILKLDKTAQNYEYDNEGKHILLSARYIPEFKWYLVVEQDEGQALITARNNLLRTLGIGLTASFLIIFLSVITVNHFQSRLENMAKTDPLTGAGNRRSFDERYQTATYKSERYNEPFSIIILDLDDFKPINDTYGHLEGDRILVAIAQVISRVIRPTDMLARWGGDEFIIILDGKSNDAKALANRVKKAMKEASDIPITFSCGIAEYTKGEDIKTLTHRADKALYTAKAKGGDFAVIG